MSSRTARPAGRRLAAVMTTLTVVAWASAIPRSGSAQESKAGGSASISNESDKARELKTPAFQTREERRNAKPLDWNSTIGTPTPRTLTDAERKATAAAPRGTSSAGAPNRKAKDEAHKLYPDDWK